MQFGKELFCSLIFGIPVGLLLTGILICWVLNSIAYVGFIEVIAHWMLLQVTALQRQWKIKIDNS